MANEVFTTATFAALVIGSMVAAAISRLSTSDSAELSQIVGAKNAEIVIGALAFIASMVTLAASYAFSMSAVPDVLLAFFVGFTSISVSTRVGKSLKVDAQPKA